MFRKILQYIRKLFQSEIRNIYYVKTGYDYGRFYLIYDNIENSYSILILSAKMLTDNNFFEKGDIIQLSVIDFNKLLKNDQLSHVSRLPKNIFKECLVEIKNIVKK